jgi:N-methylhydantoinase B
MATETEPELAQSDVCWDGSLHSYRPDDAWRSRVSPTVPLHNETTDDMDPVLYEVIRNRMWANNMAHGETLTRISGSPVFQALDFNMCVMTEDAEVVMNAPFILYLDTGAPLFVKYVMENFGEAPGVEEGDVFLGNDPWVGAVHQMDVMLAAPVFVDGRLFAWVSNAGHQYDLGGIVPGGWPQNAPDIYSDPTLLSPFKLVERGVMRTDLERLYRRQSRMPDLVALDLRAQLSGCRYAVHEMLEMVDKFGAGVVKAAMRRILDNGQQAFREKLERLPDGRWSEVSYVDEPMPGDRHVYRVQINATKEGGRLTLDNEGTGPQLEGTSNIVYSAFAGSVVSPLSVSLGWDQLFSIGGLDRQLEFRLTPGTITCADYPSEVSGGIMTANVVSDGINLMISRMAAGDPELRHDTVGATGALSMLVLAGVNDRGEAVGQAVMDGCALGSAGRGDRDGVDVTGPSWSPLMKLLNVEAEEEFFPIMFLYRRESADGGGAGRHRGGTGIETAFTPYRAAQISVITNVGGQSGSTESGKGLMGGYPAPTLSHTVLKGTNLKQEYAERRVPTNPADLRADETIRLRAKSNGTLLAEGDVVIATYSGGGGWGDPIERDPELVAHDVARGLVSQAVAAEVYAVALDGEGGIDVGRTETLRRQVRGERAGWPVAVRDRRSLPATPATGEAERQVLDGVVARDHEGQRILACRHCDEPLSDYTGNYKEGLRVHEGPLTLVPRVPDPSFFLDDCMVFRRFCCPGCQTLLTTEVVREGEPVVPEFVLRAPGDGAVA